jgi:hypothetical protein
MTVYVAGNGTIRPGRFTDAVATATRAGKIFGAHGAQRPRLLLAGTAGELVNAFAFSVEFDNLDDYAAFSDDLGPDAEAQAFIQSLNAPDSAITQAATLLTADVPRDRPKRSERGAIVEVFFMRPRPGAVEGLVDLSSRWHDAVERHGAVNTHLLSVIHGGSQSGLLISVAEYTDNRAWARATNAINTSPAGQALASEFASASGPGDLVFSGTYMDVPI